MRQLAQEYAALEPFCAQWCLPDSTARSEARVGADMADIEAFYGAIAPRAEAALTHLSAQQLGALSSEDENLLKLLLALAEIGPAVEWFGQPRVIDGYTESKFPLVLAIDDCAAQ